MSFGIRTLSQQTASTRVGPIPTFSDIRISTKFATKLVPFLVTPVLLHYFAQNEFGECVLTFEIRLGIKFNYDFFTFILTVL